jgi:hypothetical protein
LYGRAKACRQILNISLEVTTVILYLNRQGNIKHNYPLHHLAPRFGILEQAKNKILPLAELTQTGNITKEAQL